MGQKVKQIQSDRVRHSGSESETDTQSDRVRHSRSESETDTE